MSAVSCLLCLTVSDLCRLYAAWHHPDYPLQSTSRAPSLEKEVSSSMDNTIREYFQSLLSKWIKLPMGGALALGILIAASFFILSEDPYINVSGKRLLLEFPQFQRCEVIFRKPITINAYSVEQIKNSGIVKDEPRGQTIPVNTKGKILPIVNLVNQALASPPDPSKIFLVTVVSESSMNFQIEALSIDGEPQDLSNSRLSIN